LLLLISQHIVNDLEELLPGIEEVSKMD